MATQKPSRVDCFRLKAQCNCNGDLSNQQSVKKTKKYNFSQRYNNVLM